MEAELTLRERLVAVPDVMKARAIAAGPALWGRDDCLMAYADLLRDVLGYDIAHAFRGRYRTKTGFVRVLRRMGYASLSEAFVPQATGLGWMRIDPADAAPGDAGVLAAKGVESCAMLHASGFWIARGANGFVAAPPPHCRIAFRIA